MTISLVPLAARMRPSAPPGGAVPTHSAQFDGVDDTLRLVGGYPGRNHARRGTISFWWKNTAVEDRTIVSAGANQQTDNGTWLRQHAGVRWRVRQRVAGLDEFRWTHDRSFDTEWRHWVFNWDDRAENEPQVYENGELWTGQTNVFPGPDVDLFMWDSVDHFIGSLLNTEWAEGYCYDFITVNDEVLAPTAFAAGVAGQSNPGWYPIDFAGSYPAIQCFTRLRFEEPEGGGQGNDLGKDSSGNGFHYTQVGGPVRSAEKPAVPAPGQVPQYSSRYVGVNTRVRRNHSTAQDGGDRRVFTISVWVRLDTISGNRVVFSAGDGSGWHSIEIVNGQIQFRIFTGNRTASTARITSNTWHHIVWQYNADPGTLEFLCFVDGTDRTSDFSITSTPDNESYVHQDGIEHTWGSYYSDFGNGLNGGNLYDARIVSGSIVAPTEFAAGVAGSPNPGWYPIYNAHAYPSPSCNLRFEDDSDIPGGSLGKDSSGNGINYSSVTGSPTREAAKPVVPSAGGPASSLDLSANDDSAVRLQYPSAGNLRVWTISFWYYPTTSSGQKIIFWADSFTYIGLTSSGYLRIRESSTAAFDYVSTDTYNQPQWYHLVVELDADSNSCKMWVDGEAITFSTSNGPDAKDYRIGEPTPRYHFAGSYANGNEGFAGYLYDLWYVDGQKDIGPTAFGAGTPGSNWYWKEYDGPALTGNSVNQRYEGTPGAGSGLNMGQDSSGLGNHWDEYLTPQKSASEIPPQPP